NLVDFPSPPLVRLYCKDFEGYLWRSKRTLTYDIPTVPYRKCWTTCSKVFTSTTLFCNEL
uniref:Uncharacterized protein n=1 Tax=Amphimedon queenslandica TaxID=400682 RepID=A0A1X7TRY7_AMPQE